jgi:predicted flap endonuclease-1-like 5' DNA nuclease
MRLDYALYGLAIVLFALTAITFVITPEDLLYGAVTAIVGAIALVGGYALKPRNDVAQVMQTPVVNPEPPTPVTQQTPAPAVETPIEEPPMTTPTVEASDPQSTPEDEKIQVEEPKVIIEEPKVEPETLVTAATIQAPETEQEQEDVCPAPVQADVASAQNAASPEEDTGFGQIRGISAKRAEQLKANGINNLQELAAADAEVLSEKLGVSPKIVKMWIGCAKKQVK